MLGEPLHLELGFGIPLTVQKYSFMKLQLAHTSELKSNLNPANIFGGLSSNRPSPELVLSPDPTL